MKKIEITAFELAERFIGMKEVSGKVSNPAILAMLNLDVPKGWASISDDEVPWCSAFINYICWLLRLPRSKSLRARSWLTIGEVITESLSVDFDIVILKREENSPGPDVIDAPGHVGFFAGVGDGGIYILGGNQNDQVNISRYPAIKVLGFRRLYG